LEERKLQPKRTVEHIIADNEKYKKAGSPLKKAKAFNNAIGKPFFNVPLTQVRMLYTILIQFLTDKYTMYISIILQMYTYISLLITFSFAYQASMFGSLT
jgi:hypothetical protein